MKFLQAVFFGAATFLLGTIAITGIDLVQVIEGSGSTFGSSYMEQTKSIITLIAFGGPVIFLIGGVLASIDSGAAPRTNQAPASGATSLGDLDWWTVVQGSIPGVGLGSSVGVRLEDGAFRLVRPDGQSTSVRSVERLPDGRVAVRDPEQGIELVLTPSTKGK